MEISLQPVSAPGAVYGEFENIQKIRHFGISIRKKSGFWFFSPIRLFLVKIWPPGGSGCI